MIRKILVTGLILAGLWINATAQISHGGRPLPLTQLKSGGGVSFEEMPPFDVAEALRLDSLNESDLRSGYRFAYKFMTDFTRTNAGVSFILPDGTYVWRLGIRSKGALSINVLFSEYELPEGAKLFLYNSNQSHILGAFNHLNNSDLDILPVAPVYGDELIIEYQEPPQAAFAGRLRVGEVNHAYRELRGREPSDTQSSFHCMPPASCFAESLAGADSLKRSTVLLIVDGITGCSGVLVNNTAADKKPYLLTASHCLNNVFQVTNPDYVKMAGSIVAFFNYESPLCSPVLRGAEEMSIASAEFCAVNEDHDMALVKLKEPPPVYYRPYYAGWNITDEGTAPYYNMHHPSGSVKRVGWFDGQLTLTTYSTLAFEFAADSHWEVSKWTEGSTSGGSSGSPLFDSKGYVIGGLSGGYSSCLNTRRTADYFFALSKVWDADPSPERQLKHWLDPANKNQPVCEGMDPYAPTMSYRLSNIASSGHIEDARLDTISGSGGVPVFGNNGNKVTEYAEAYKVPAEAWLFGAYFVTSASGDYAKMEVEVSVYSGSTKPETLLHTERFRPAYANYSDTKDGSFVETDKPLNREQETYIQFEQPVQVNGSFYVSYRIVSAPEKTYFSAYSLPPVNAQNTTWVKNGSGWAEAQLVPAIGYKTSLFIDPVIQYTYPVGTEKATLVSPIRIYADTSHQLLHIILPDGMEEGLCLLYTTDGKLLQQERLHSAYTTLDVSAHTPGIYVAQIVCKGITHTQKILF